MAYYDALIAAWNGATQPPTGVTGTALTSQMTTAQKIAAVNTWTVPGPNADVPVSSVIGNLMLSGAYLTLEAFSQSATNSNEVHDTALVSAKLLIALVTTPNAPIFNMSDAGRYSVIKSMLDALLAQETASAGSVGVTQSVHDMLLGLCATTAPWWQSAGLSGLVSQADLDAAGGLS
jgi:hypothetical protein